MIEYVHHMLSVPFNLHFTKQMLFYYSNVSDKADTVKESIRILDRCMLVLDFMKVK